MANGGHDIALEAPINPLEKNLTATAEKIKIITNIIIKTIFNPNTSTTS